MAQPQSSPQQVDPYAQAIWDALGILGFDLDGDPTPAASIIGSGQAFRVRFLNHIQDIRAQLDECAECES